MKFRRLVALVFCLATTAAGCGDDGGGLSPTATTRATSATTSTTAEAPDDALGPFAEFFSISHPFSVEYPESWEVEEDTFGSVVTFLSALTSEDDPLRESVNVVVEDFQGADLSLDEYVEFALDRLEELISDIQFNGEIDDVMGEMPSKILTYTGSLEGFTFTWVQEVSIFEGSAYILTYTGAAQGDDYLEFRPHAIAIFQSFDFHG